MQLALLVSLLTIVLVAPSVATTELPDVPLLDGSLPQAAAPWLTILVLTVAAVVDGIWQTWRRAGFLLSRHFLLLACGWEALLLAVSMAALVITGSWALFATGVQYTSFTAPKCMLLTSSALIHPP